MLTFKVKGLKYLSELLHVRVINRTLRSSEAKVLVFPRYNYVYSGNRAFSGCAPKMSNEVSFYVPKAESLIQNEHLRLKAYQSEKTKLH